MSKLAEINRVYGVKAKRGQRVVVDGKPGRITSARGHYVMVRFDGYRFSMPCHPTWRFDYSPEAADAKVMVENG